MIKCSFATVCNEVINMLNKIPFLSAEQKIKNLSIEQASLYVANTKLLGETL